MGQFLDLEESQFADDEVLESMWIRGFDPSKLSINDEGCDSVMVYYDGWFKGHLLPYYHNGSDVILINNNYIRLSQTKEAWT